MQNTQTNETMTHTNALEKTLLSCFIEIATRASTTNDFVADLKEIEIWEGGYVSIEGDKITVSGDNGTRTYDLEPVIQIIEDGFFF